MAYEKEDLEVFLEEFLTDDTKFKSGHVNDDVVDSMIICHCLDRDWWEFFAKKVENMEDEWSTSWVDHIAEKAHVVEPYLDGWGTIGTMEAMGYSINY